MKVRFRPGTTISRDLPVIDASSAQRRVPRRLPSITGDYRGVPVLTVPEFGPKLLRDLASELPPLELLPNRAVALSCCLRSAPVDASRYISRPRTGRGNFGVRETSGIRRCPHAGRGDDCRRVSAGGRIGRVARLGRRCILALTSHMTSEWYALSFRIRRVSFSAQELRTVREAGNPTLRIVGPRDAGELRQSRWHAGCLLRVTTRGGDTRQVRSE